MDGAQTLLDETAQVRGLHRLVRDQGETGAALDLSRKRGEITTDLSVVTRLPDQDSGDGCVATPRRENDGPLGRGTGPHGSGSFRKDLPAPT